MADTVLSEAPAEQSGAENNQANGPLSVSDLAASFVEQVQTDQEAKQADEAKAEVTETPKEAEASANQEEDVLSQSISESDEEEGEETEETEEVEESEESNDVPPKAVSKLLKQVNKLTARAKGAEETALHLQAEIANLKANQPNGNQAQPAQPELENIQNFQDLENLRQEAQAAKKFALQHIGKDFVEVDGKEYSDDDIRNILTQADEYLTEKIPQRGQHLQQKAQWANDTQKTFPWLNTQDDSEQATANRQLYQQIRGQKQYADVLDNLPNGDFVTGVLVKGIQKMQEEQAEANAPKKKAVKKPKTPPPTDGGDASPPIENSTTRKQKEKSKFLDRKKPLSANDLAAFLAD